jgi:hypothetical protein
MDPEFLGPSLGRWRTLLFQIAVLIVGYGALVYWPELMRLVGRLPPCEQLPWWRAIAIGLALVFVVPAASLVWDGYRALRLRQWPLPGTLLFRRRRVKRGRSVLFHAYASFVAAATIIAFFGYLAQLAWPELRPAFATYPVCNGA